MLTDAKGHETRALSQMKSSSLLGFSANTVGDSLSVGVHVPIRSGDYYILLSTNTINSNNTRPFLRLGLHPHLSKRASIRLNAKYSSKAGPC